MSPKLHKCAICAIHFGIPYCLFGDFGDFFLRIRLFWIFSLKFGQNRANMVLFAGSWTFIGDLGRVYNLILNCWLKWQSPQKKTSQTRSQCASPTRRGKRHSISWYCSIGLSVLARTGKPATWRKAAGGTRTVRRAGKGTRRNSQNVRFSPRRSGTCARWGAPL